MTWIKEAPSADQWRKNTDRFVRLTEDGVVRVTEDMLYFRIIEYEPITWTNTLPPAATSWTKQS